MFSGSGYEICSRQKGKYDLLCIGVLCAKNKKKFLDNSI
jgi:hypothetical protein